MQSLLSGADCSVSANPLHQALKSFSHDTSLQRDLAASGSNAAYGSSSQAGPSQQFKMQQQSGNANHLEADRFFRDAVATPHHGHFNQQRMPSPYDMAEMRQAMPSYKQGDARQMDHAPGEYPCLGWSYFLTYGHAAQVVQVRLHGRKISPRCETPKGSVTHRAPPSTTNKCHRYPRNTVLRQ